MKKILFLAVLAVGSLSALAVQPKPALRPAPAENVVSPQSGVESEWGEWYDYISGSLSSSNWWTYCTFMGIDYEQVPKRTTLQRRDDQNNPNHAQLRLKDFFGEGLDWTMDYDIDNSLLCWEELETGKYFPGYDDPAEYHTVFISNGRAQFYPKLQLSLRTFFVCQDRNMGFLFEMAFISDNQSVTYTYPRLSADNVNAETFTVTFDSIGRDITSLKYVLLNTPYASRFVDDESKSIYELMRKNYAGFDMVTLTPEQVDGYRAEYAFKQSGPTWLFLIAYDKDGDIVSTNSRTIYAQLDGPGKWESIGMGTFTDPMTCDLLDEYELLKEGADTIWCPDWINVTSWPVEVQESKTTPGLYRVVNPYKASHFTDAEFGYVDDYAIQAGLEYSHRRKYIFDRDHNHNYYLVIHAENPGFIWSEPNLAGYAMPQNDEIDNIDVDVLKVFWSTFQRCGVSMAPYMGGNPQDHTSSPLTMDDGVIRGIGGDRFELKLPVKDAITDINADSIVPVYYDLSGRRVATPASGVYIEVRGGDAHPVIR